jgi:hypothetical protein
MEQAGPAIDDPEPYVSGSFDEAFLAYDLGQLTDADYAILAEAAGILDPPPGIRRSISPRLAVPTTAPT